MISHAVNVKISGGIAQPVLLAICLMDLVWVPVQSDTTQTIWFVDCALKAVPLVAMQHAVSRVKMSKIKVIIWRDAAAEQFVWLDLQAITNVKNVNFLVQPVETHQGVTAQAVWTTSIFTTVAVSHSVLRAFMRLLMSALPAIRVALPA